MNQDTDNALPIKFSEALDCAFISKDTKVIELANKTVQITYSLN